MVMAVVGAVGNPACGGERGSATTAGTVSAGDTEASTGGSTTTGTATTIGASTSDPSGDASGGSGGDSGDDSGGSDDSSSGDIETDPCAASPGAVIDDGFEDGTAAWTIEGSVELEQDPTRVRCGGASLRVDFRDESCGAASCDDSGNNCYENFPQVVSTGYEFELRQFYMSWWVYYPEDFTFYQGPCLPVRGMQGHFVRFSRLGMPPDPNDSWYVGGAFPDFGQYRADDDHLGIRGEWHAASWGDGDELQFGRNLIAVPIPLSSLAGAWNHYELYVDLGSPGGFDGTTVWAVDDVVVFDIHDDAVHTGDISEPWGPQAELGEGHPGLLSISQESLQRLGLVSNPNSSFGGRTGDVYWIDDVVLRQDCPEDRPVCMR
jgi:hypothetical protein